MTDALIIYHDHCADGRFAAAAARYALTQRGKTVQIHPATYGEPAPEVDDYAEVYLVDFSYPYQEMMRLGQACARVVVLDHHKTAQAALSEAHGHPSLDIHFDMTESGATMVWKHFFPDRDVPEVLQYIRDRDLWLFELPDSKAVTAALNLKARTVDAAQSILEQGVRMADLVQDGTLLLEQWHNNVNAIAQTGVTVTVYDDTAALVRAHTAYVVNCQPMFASDVSQRVFDTHSDADFVLSWCLMSGAYGARVSLRSAGVVDVGALAVVRKGGGHHNAAGCEFLDVSELPSAMKSKILHWRGNRI